MENKKLLLIPMIDACGDMTSNANIHKVNFMMSQMSAQLTDIEKEGNVEFFLAPIVFNSGARWAAMPTGEPVRPHNFVWSDVQAFGSCDLGSAYGLLIEKLTEKKNGGWLDCDYCRPILMLFLDGEANAGWEAHLDKLKKNVWFKAAIKIGIDVSEEENGLVLKAFTDGGDVLSWTDCFEKGELLDLIKRIINQAEYNN